MEASDSNKTLVKNTLFLYIRMGVMMIIGFFTARITLSVLGVDNYGINNVVGGLVSMFSLISGTLTASISRFLTFGLGKGDIAELKKTFSICLTIQILLGIIILIGLETIGLWFLNNKLIIPIDRLFAANVVYQFSILTFILGILSVPFNAMIIAHEKMSAFAFMTIFEAVSKLLIVVLLIYVSGDKLILFGGLVCFQGLISQSIYWIYCRRKFAECRFHVVKTLSSYKEIFIFSGWNFIGSAASLLNYHGTSIVLNMFYGPIVNTGQGIGNQITSILGQFSGNFMIALDPQVTKNYASNNMERTYSLIFKGTKLSYFLFLIISIPVLLETPQVLRIWLGQIPEYAVAFVRLSIILSLVNLLSSTLIKAQLATGKLKYYQIVVGGTLLLVLPISYFLLRAGFHATITVVVAIFISQICMFLRLVFLRNMIGLSIRKFIREVYIRIIFVSLLSTIVPLILYYELPETLCRFVLVTASGVIMSCVFAYFVGFDSQERYFINTTLSHIIKRRIA